MFNVDLDWPISIYSKEQEEAEDREALAEAELAYELFATVNNDPAKQPSVVGFELHPDAILPRQK